MRLINLKGKRFGKVVVLRRLRQNDKWGAAKWAVKCDCGRRSVMNGWLLRNRIAACRFCCHNQSGATGKYIREWRCYCAMKTRCLAKTDASFKWYGARGITIDPRWLGPDGFRNFMKDMGRRPEGTTLDRENPEGHYTPGNCRWANKWVQAENKRCNYTEKELAVLREEARQQHIEIFGDDCAFVY